LNLNFFNRTEGSKNWLNRTFKFYNENERKKLVELDQFKAHKDVAALTGVKSWLQPVLEGRARTPKLSHT